MFRYCVPYVVDQDNPRKVWLVGTMHAEDGEKPRFACMDGCGFSFAVVLACGVSRGLFPRGRQMKRNAFFF